MTQIAEDELGTGAASLEARCECPAFDFDRYGIVFHVPVSRSTGALPAGKPAIESFERDILAYAYRDLPGPFATYGLDPDAIPGRTVILEVPAELAFESEGKRVSLACHGVEGPTRRRAFSLTPSRTDFMSGDISVLHVGLRPHRSGDGAAPESRINEYDVIKLIKLWEGGEHLGCGDGPSPTLRLGESGEPLSLSDLAGTFLGPGETLLPRDTEPRDQRTRKPGTSGPFVVGTVQLLTDDYADVRAAILRLRTASDLPEEDDVHPRELSPTERQVLAVGGFVQGLIDFVAVDRQELADVFAPLDVGTFASTTVQRGTLLSLAREDRSFDAAGNTIAVSPYLLLPHAVLLHDEACLRSALREEMSTTLDEARTERNRVQKLLEKDLVGGNVFHYPAERELYESAYASRGLNKLEQQARARLGDLEQQIQEQRDQRGDMAEDLISLLLLILTVVTLKSDVPLVIGLPVAFVLVVGYMLFRYRNILPGYLSVFHSRNRAT